MPFDVMNMSDNALHNDESSRLQSRERGTITMIYEHMTYRFSQRLSQYCTTPYYCLLLCSLPWERLKAWLWAPKCLLCPWGFHPFCDWLQIRQNYRVLKGKLIIFIYFLFNSPYQTTCLRKFSNLLVFLFILYIY
jgi:hypothetical protein